MQPICLDALAKSFLQWTKTFRKPATHRHYSDLLRHLTKKFPKGLQVRHLRRYHLTEIVSKHPEWGQNQIHNFLAAVNRLLTWGCEEGYLDAHPIQYLKKPGRKARTDFWTDADFESALNALRSEEFRRLVNFAWVTGIRPQEAGQILVKDYRPEYHTIVLPPDRAKGGIKHRVIYLTSQAEALMDISGKDPDKPVFCSSSGNAWNKNSINSQFKRLKSRTGKSLYFGGIRKGYCTKALINGVDVVTLANLMGHSDVTMISRVYSQVHQDTTHMLKSAEKANG